MYNVRLKSLTKTTGLTENKIYHGIEKDGKYEVRNDYDVIVRYPLGVFELCSDNLTEAPSIPSYYTLRCSCIGFEEQRNTLLNFLAERGLDAEFVEFFDERCEDTLDPDQEDDQ